MKQRLDVYLAENGLCPSRERARAVIMAGEVFVNGQRADKAGHALREGDRVEVRGAALPYVSRGGLKLEKAVASFGIELSGVTAADIGASTGGFTDCMLQNGAKRVYAVDVGYGQLAWKLRSDERVICLERTNARYLTAEQIPEPLDLFSADVSFISLKLIYPALAPLCREGAAAICLVKPQFEAGRELVGKHGVVRDPATHRLVLEQALENARSGGFSPCGLDFSPVKGPEGNIEYLLYSIKGGPEQVLDIASVVERAHGQLNEAR